MAQQLKVITALPDRGHGVGVPASTPQLTTPYPGMHVATCAGRSSIT